MAEVLPPLTQPTSTITMLHPRPSSSDAFQGSSSGQTYQQQSRMGNTPRSIYNTQGGTSTYRGTSAGPVQPYAFQSTPHLRQETRTISAPAAPNSQSSTSTVGSQKHGHVTTSSTSTVSSETSSSPSIGAQRSPSKDDFSSGSPRPASFITLSSSIPDLTLKDFDTTPKASPDRYRRVSRRSDSSGVSGKVSIPQSPSFTAPSGSGMGSVSHLYTPPAATLSRTPSEETQISKSGTSESAKRYRRRSMNNLDTNNLGQAGTNAPSIRPVSSSGQGENSTSASTTSTIRPLSYHERSNSNESAQIRTDAVTPPPTTTSQPDRTSPQKSPVIPARGSSAGPSPLSKSASTNDPHSPIRNPQTSPMRQQPPSPAHQHLAALSEKDLNKGYKSRLRRAFSFGSAAELRKASGENVAPRRKPKTPEEIEAEQEEIARQQEAAGIGAGIYSGQGGFTGSTDNLSISSTASSASMMLRKMGKGMKKGGKSIKGLFRPKSVVGVPAADGPIEPSLAQVSMVTVEAERQKVNVNARPESAHGGTGFPKLERNSIDTANAADAIYHEHTDSFSRKSIVGSDRDRAEVLAAVKKGILKRTGSPVPATPEVRTRDGRSVDSQRSQSPASSMPGTPRDERQSRSLTSTGSADYFSTRLVSKSMPGTPYGGNRNISFSPRIQFYDAWSANDYDRRGDIATCNRLTPMLAQQIKEELNTFKMEMEVHEASKPYTHFF